MKPRVVFDKYASQYDEHFSNTAVGKAQRQRVHHLLLPFLKKSDTVLEINCGTGIDAVHISQYVKEVLATDISPAMIGEAKTKLKNITNLQFQVCAIQALPEELKDKKYDLLFSNFGGLNCIEPLVLQEFAANISAHINPGGRLVLVVMGRHCIWENLFFLLKNDTRLYRRRSSHGIFTEIEGEKMYTHYYSPSELGEAFKVHFIIKKVRPVGLFIPPSFLNRHFHKGGLAIRMLIFLEKLFGSFRSFSDYADHYLMVFEKKDGSGR